MDTFVLSYRLLPSQRKYNNKSNPVGPTQLITLVKLKSVRELFGLGDSGSNLSRNCLLMFILTVQ